MIIINLVKTHQSDMQPEKANTLRRNRKQSYFYTFLVQILVFIGFYSNWIITVVDLIRIKSNYFAVGLVELTSLIPINKLSNMELPKARSSQIFFCCLPFSFFILHNFYLLKFVNFNCYGSISATLPLSIFLHHVLNL